MCESLRQMMEEGVAKGVFPGAQLLVMADGETVAQVCVGRLKEEGPEVTPETLFDLASLTKPLVGATLAMYLVQKGLLSIDAPVACYLPWFSKEGRGAVTVRHLLDHSSGLPAWRPFYESLVSMPVDLRGEGLRLLLQSCDLEAPAGSRVCYSDIGFMLLKLVLETVAGVDVRTLFNHEIRTPLGLFDLMYAPEIPSGRAVASTETCPWRRRTLVGEVHDDNAWSMGGVALHAGLFGSSQEVGHLVWHLVERFRDEERPSPFQAAVVRSFFSESRSRGRGLGFDMPSERGSASGRYFGPGSVGHLGFTGTSFWADPKAGRVVVLLTNRLYFSRDNTAIRLFRPRVHDLAMETFGGVGRRGGLGHFNPAF